MFSLAIQAGKLVRKPHFPMLWRQVDLKAGEVRLDPGTTKNLEGRVFYLTSDLTDLLKAQRKAADRIQRTTSDERPSGTWSAPASPSAWR
jgi:predicted RNA-binding protein YlxR (DUF448 family)